MSRIQKKVKILSFIIAILLIAFVSYVEIKKSKFSLPGEISKCTSGDEAVFQYITDLESYTTSYYNKNGQRISCDLDTTTEFCENFLATVSDCVPIYRNFEDKNYKQIYEEEAEEIVEKILKNKSL